MKKRTDFSLTTAPKSNFIVGAGAFLSSGENIDWINCSIFFFFSFNNLLMQPQTQHSVFIFIFFRKKESFLFYFMMSICCYFFSDTLNTTVFLHWSFAFCHQAVRKEKKKNTVKAAKVESRLQPAPSLRRVDHTDEEGSIA